MNIIGVSEARLPIEFKAAKKEVSHWVRVWDAMPETGSIVPVWDGDYLYYAAYWDKEGSQFWVVTDQISIGLDDIKMRKTQGEQVYPIHWMKITEPTE